MGGNALSNPSVRLKKEVYDKVWKAIEIPLKEIFSRVEIIKAYSEKESFGDMDILVSGPTSWKKFNIDDYSFFQNREIVVGKNSTSLSFGYDLLTGRFQVDLILIEEQEFDSAHLFYDYNDLGGMMGVISKAMGFKLTPHGLIYSLYHGSSEVDDILVTSNRKEILDFIGYEINRYKEFSTLEEIFNFVVDNKYFRKDMYLLNNRDGDSRRRDSKRTTYLALLEYLDKIQVNVGRGAPLIDKEEIFKEALERFPGFSEKLRVSKVNYLRKRVLKSRFSGDTITELTGIQPGVEMGKFLSFIKQNLTLPEAGEIIESKPFADKFIKEKFDTWKKSQYT